MSRKPGRIIRSVESESRRLARGVFGFSRKWGIEEIGFVDVKIGPPVDTFKGAGGEDKARLFAVYGYAFLARKPR